MPFATRALVAAIALLAWLGIIYVCDQPGTRWWVYSYLLAIMAMSVLTLYLAPAH